MLETANLAAGQKGGRRGVPAVTPPVNQAIETKQYFLEARVARSLLIGI
jgi:hypothetical protein